MRTFILIHEKARDLAKKVIDDTPLDGKMKVEIKKVGSKRSTAQNNLYHMWVNQMAKELGYNHDEMHQTLVQKFLQPEVMTVAGNLVTVWPSTTKLKVAEFSEFLNQIDIFSNTDLGIVLVKPMDEWYMAMGEKIGNN